MDSLAADLAATVEDYHRHGNVGALLDAVRRLARTSDPERLAAAAASYRDLPEVIIPVYESIVDRAPTDAQALVILANAYWLTGRGPDVVGDLASRAIAIDAANRGAWHLWALAESSVRARVDRWRQVVARFPDDHLARAALADNATSLASAEHDPVALATAIATYQGLLAEATEPAHRRALETALTTLASWTF
ncbi:MAG TPA: hypothetical protein VMH39_16090 [Gemmatimonadaceae bacterium]|nr:hypothetical protein [Gemmatimonadaceae bacterium]